MNSSHNETAHISDDIRLLITEIKLLIQTAWKKILFGVIVSLIGAFIYIYITSDRYQASFQITMAKIYMPEKPFGISIKGINVEEPNALIARLSFPTGFDDQVTAECELNSPSNAMLQIGKNLKLTIPRESNDLVEFSIVGRSHAYVERCAKSMVAFIIRSQDLRADSYFEAVKMQIKEIDMLLNKGNDKSKNHWIGGVYERMSPLTGMLYLEGEKQSLRRMMEFRPDSRAHLLNPIFVNKVDQKLHKVIFFALLMGILFGITLAFISQPKNRPKV